MINNPCLLRNYEMVVQKSDIFRMPCVTSNYAELLVGSELTPNEVSRRAVILSVLMIILITHLKTGEDAPCLHNEDRDHPHFHTIMAMSHAQVYGRRPPLVQM